VFDHRVVCKDVDSKDELTVVFCHGFEKAKEVAFEYLGFWDALDAA
jgi:hypothetical protein